MILVWQAQQASAATWNLANSGNWGTSGNWTGGVPNAIGAVATFPDLGGNNKVITVDGTGYTIGTLSLDGTPSNKAYTISGTQALTFDVSSGNASLVSNGAGPTVNVNLILRDSLDITGSAPLTLGGVISTGTGTTAITVNGPTVTFSGSSANTYNGTTSVSAGTLNLGKTGTSNAIAGNAAVSGGTLKYTGASTDMIANTATVTISGTGTLDLANVSDTISTLTQSAGTLSTGSGTLTAATLNVSGGTSTGNIALTGNFNGTNTTGTATIGAALVLSSGGHTFDIANGGTTSVSSVVSGSGASVTKATGAGTLIFTNANTYTGGTTVSAGTLRVNNSTGSGTGTGAVSVNGSGVLGGSGLITTTVANAGVTVAAGGKLSAGSGFKTTGTLTFNLNGTGKMDLSGAVTASNSKAIQVDLGGSALAATSDKVVISNTSATISNSSLDIGSGVLEFDDFDFTVFNGVTTGTYVLFDTSETIAGSFGLTTSGSINAFVSGSISFANSNQDIVLTVAVAPEPTSAAVLVLASSALMARRRSKRK